MPRNTEHQQLEEEAAAIVQTLLTRYLELNLHDLNGGDIQVGWSMEQTFQATRATVVHLVAAGLRREDPPFL